MIFHFESNKATSSINIRNSQYSAVCTKIYLLHSNHLSVIVDSAMVCHISQFQLSGAPANILPHNQCVIDCRLAKSASEYPCRLAKKVVPGKYVDDYSTDFF